MSADTTGWPEPGTCPTCGAPVLTHYDEDGIESRVTPVPDPRVVELWRAAEHVCAGCCHRGTGGDCASDGSCWAIPLMNPVGALRDEMEARDE